MGTLRALRTIGVALATFAALGAAEASDHRPLAPVRPARPPEVTLLDIGEHPRNAGHNWTSNLQGAASDKTHYWYFAQARRVWKIPMSVDLDRDFSVALSKPLSDVERRLGFNHMGDPDFYDGHLYVPMERYRTHRPGAITLRGADLSFQGIVTLSQAGAPWVAVNPVDRRLYSSEFSHVTALLRYPRSVAHDSLSLGFPDPVLLFDEQGAPVLLDALQGGTFAPDGRLYLVTRDGVDGFDLVTSPREAVARRVVHFKIDYHPRWLFGYPVGDELEGLEWLDFDRGQVSAPGIGGQLHVVMIDNDGPAGGADDLYFKHFRVTEPSKGIAVALRAPRP